MPSTNLGDSAISELMQSRLLTNLGDTESNQDINNRGPSPLEPVQIFTTEDWTENDIVCQEQFDIFVKRHLEMERELGTGFDDYRVDNFWKCSCCSILIVFAVMGV
eukprot:SAG31_NODE_18428_length_636_cov_2.869646_1_plen_105_part_01